MLAPTHLLMVAHCSKMGGEGDRHSGHNQGANFPRLKRAADLKTSSGICPAGETLPNFPNRRLHPAVSIMTLAVQSCLTYP